MANRRKFTSEFKKKVVLEAPKEREKRWGDLIFSDSYLRDLTANLQPFRDVVFNISTPYQKNFLFF
jgi:hypothetical protein